MSRIASCNHQSWEGALPAMQEEQRSMRESLRVQRRLWRVLLLIAGLERVMNFAL